MRGGGAKVTELDLRSTLDIVEDESSNANGGFLRATKELVESIGGGGGNALRKPIGPVLMGATALRSLPFSA